MAHIKNLVRYIPLFYIIYYLRPDKKFLSKIIFSIITIALLQSFICIGQALGGDVLVEMFRPKDVTVGGQLVRGQDLQFGSYYTRFTGSFARSSDLGNYLAFSICFLIAAYFSLGKKPRYLLLLAPVLAAMFLSSSRISWLSAFLAVGVILFKIRHRLRLIYFIFPVILVVVVLVGMNVIDFENLYEDYNIINRFFYIFTTDYLDNIATSGRLYTVFYAMPAVFSSNALLGIGPGSFMYISKHMSEDEAWAKADDLGLEIKALYYVHDVGYAALFIQVGLLGLVVFVWMFVRLYRMASTSYRFVDDPLVRTLMLGTMGLFVAVAVQNLASFNLMYRNQAIIIWSQCGLVALFTHSRERTKDYCRKWGTAIENTDSQ